MKKVIVASENPVKIKVAEKAFASMYPGEQFEFVGVKTDSVVPDQPMEDEARIGANNRLKFIKEKYPDADFWIAQEGGIFTDKSQLSVCAWITVCDKSGFISEACTSSFYLPKKVAEYVKSGLELGHATDKFFNTENMKQKGGIVSILTDGVIDRVHYYLQPAILALSEIKHKDWFV